MRWDHGRKSCCNKKNVECTGSFVFNFSDVSKQVTECIQKTQVVPILNNLVSKHRVKSCTSKLKIE